MATFGYTSIGGSSWGTEDNKQRACKFTLSEDGVVTQISNYCKTVWAASVMKCAIYSDDTGAPNALMGTTSETNLTQDTLQWWDFSCNISLSAGTYWLVSWTASIPTGYYDEGAASQSKRATHAYGDWQDPFGATDETQDRQMSIYATYTASGSGMQLFTLINEMGY